MIAREMAAPLLGEFAEFFLRFALQRAFDLVDPGDGGADAVDLPLVLAADEVWKEPLDHGSSLGWRLKDPVGAGVGMWWFVRRIMKIGNLSVRVRPHDGKLMKLNRMDRPCQGHGPSSDHRSRQRAANLLGNHQRHPPDDFNIKPPDAGAPGLSPND